MYLFTITFVLVFTLVITFNYHSLLITSIYLLTTSNSILISIYTYLIILNTKDYPSLTALTCILLTYHYLSRYLPKDCYAIMVSHLLGVSTMLTYKPKYDQTIQTSTSLIEGLCGNCNAPEVFPHTYTCVECADDQQISLEYLKQQSINHINQIKE